MSSGRIWTEVEADDESPDSLLIVELPQELPEPQRRGRRPQKPVAETE